METMHTAGEGALEAAEQTREVLDAEAQRLKENVENEAQKLKAGVKNVAKKFPKAIVAAVADENVLTGGHGAWVIQRTEDDEISDDDEVYIDVKASQALEDQMKLGNEWRVPPAGGAVRVVADATGFAYSIDLHLRVRVRKLFDLDTQRLKFNAQLTITVEWLVDEKGYASYENFWKDYKPQLMLPTCRASRGDVLKNASVHRTARQYAGKQGPTRRAHHFSCEITDIFEFMQPFDMRNFPFDTQGLELKFESPPVEMPNYNPCTFGARLRPPLHEPHTVDAEADLLPSNDIKLLYGVAGGFEVLNRMDGRFPDDDASVLIIVERDATGVFYNVLLPTYLLQLFSLSVNWIDPCNIHFRLTAILTMLLTVAAKQAYIGGLLPRVGFLTPPEKTVNVTVFMFFVQVWLRVGASQQCYRNADRWGLVKTWDYSDPEKKRRVSLHAGDRRRKLATLFDRASDAWTILTLLWCLCHMGSCLRDRWRIRDRLMKAAANRDDAYFRNFHKNMRDFDSLEKSEVLTESRAARAVDDGDDTHDTCVVVVFDVGTGEAKALEYSFVDGGVALREVDRRKESLKEALQEGGTRLDAFEKWFDSAVSHTCELNGDWASLGITWDGPLVTAVTPGSKGEQAGVKPGFVLAEGGGIVSSEQPAGDCSRERVNLECEAPSSGGKFRFLKVHEEVVDGRARRAALGPVVVVATGAWFRTATGAALERAEKFLKAIHAKNPLWRFQRVSDLDECFYECVAVRYAAALHERIHDEPGGIVGVGQGSTQLSLCMNAKDENGMLAPFGLPLGNLEGRRTIDQEGRTFAEGLGEWEKKCNRRLGRWARDIGLESKKGTATATIVKNRPVVCISGCWYAAASALVDPKESPSKRMRIDEIVRELTAKKAAILAEIGSLPADDSEEMKKKVINLSNYTLISQVLGLLLPSDAEVVFARDWQLNGSTFRTTWSAGWFLEHLYGRCVNVGVDALKRAVVPYAAREAKKRKETGHAAKSMKAMRKLRSVRKVAATQ